MDLLLITGAGASRNLGVGDSHMPLMSDWAGTLCEELDSEEPGLAHACGLAPDLEGPAFEQALGELLEWERVRHLEEKFERLGQGNVGGGSHGQVLQARNRTANRLATFKAVLNRTLYTQFSHVAVDDKKAAAAYGKLLAQLGDPSVVFATTNYDRSIESALIRLKRNVRNGFFGEPPRRQLFKPGNLVEGADNDTPVLHLHGAVGWYERDGEVVLENAEERFDPSRGSPVVLYPDPQKEPMASAIVEELWREFDMAIENAPRVLVIGHSLHDRMLVERLQRVSPIKKVVVSVFSREDQKRIPKLLPKAATFNFEFKPGIGLKKDVLEHLLS